MLRHEDEQITSTRTSTSRRRWGSRIQDTGTNFCLTVRSSPCRSIRLWLSYFQKGGGLKKRFQYCLDPCSADMATLEESSRSNLAGQCDVTKNFRRVHLSRWKFSSPAFHHQVRFHSGWNRCQKGKAYGILHGRGSHVRASSPAARVQFKKAQNCDLQAEFEKYIKIRCTGSI